MPAAWLSFIGGKLKLGDGEEEGGEELAYGTGHVDLLGDRDDADAMIGVPVVLEQKLTILCNRLILLAL